MTNTILEPQIRRKSVERNGSLKLSNCIASLSRIVFSFAIAIVLLELIFNVAGVGADTRQKPDPVLGFVNMPNHEAVHRTEGYSRTFYNSFGMRNREVTRNKQDGTIRIAVLGDSSTEAIQVADSETFCQRLEDRLNGLSEGKRYEVLNFGVSAYNAAQEFVMFRERAVKFHPDIAIFMVRLNFIPFLGPPPPNKLCLLTARPLSNLVGDNELTWTNALIEQWNFTTEAKRIRSTAWLREHSRVWTVLGTIAYSTQLQLNQCKAILKDFSRLLHRYKYGSDNGAASLRKSSSTTSSSLDSESAIVFLTRMLGAMMFQASELGKKSNCRVIVFSQPVMEYAAPSKEEKLLREIMKRDNIPYEDLGNSLDQKVGANRSDLFFSTNHPTAKGHKVYAEIILEALAKHGLIKAH